MKLYKYPNRKEYIEQQIIRNQKKQNYCKVFFSDVLRYRDLLLIDRKLEREDFKPILCLGVRSGAELDIFRSTFLGRPLRNRLIRSYAIRKDKTTSGISKTKLSRRLSLGSGNYADGQVVGVELSPGLIRQDTWIGSYDEMPEKWTNRFSLLYSNSIDHSLDPEKTVYEWRRVAKPGAYVILAFAEGHDPSASDPFGINGFSELIDLWKAPVVFASETWNSVGYSEICFRLN